MATYKVVMRPALEYASSIWSPLASSTSINKLQVMQYAALRIATGCTQDTNTSMTKHSYFPYTSTYSSTRHVSDLDKHKTNTSVQDKINELNNLILDEDRDDGSILTYIDPDLNMLYNMNDIINNSSRYFDNSTFRTTVNKYTNKFYILNANIRGVSTNVDKFKLILDDLDYTFPNYWTY